ncbi:unnamed protein product [Rhizophagus irregularis]|nr:unnamed protein product [Rhizophagus irregularis]
MADKLNFGISQNPDTKVYILEWIRKSYEKVVLKFLYDLQNFTDEFLNKVESYLANKLFDNIKEIGKGGFSTVYSAIWKNGLLYYDDDLIDDEKWIRNSNTKVALKCLHNSQNALDEFINEVKAYPRQKINNILKIYGISQNPSTKDLPKHDDNINNNTVEIIDFTNL